MRKLVVCVLLSALALSAFGRGSVEGRIYDAVEPTAVVLAADARVMSDAGIAPANYERRPPTTAQPSTREYVARGVITGNTNPLDAKLVASIDRLHEAMPALKDLVAELGGPTRILFVAADGATFVNVYYSAADFFYLQSEPWHCGEIRFENEGSYRFRGALHVSSTFEAVVSVLGNPREVSYGEGGKYVEYDNAGARFFFDQRDLVTGMYLYKPGTSFRSPAPAPGSAGTTMTVQPWADIRTMKLPPAAAASALRAEVLPTLTFNLGTDFGGAAGNSRAAQVMESGRNPGLMVRAIHGGLTGAGVNVAIIDQNLPGTGHPEYAGKVAAYYDVGTGQPRTSGSMHGPAVLSLLVGTQAGTAPGARVYYAAVPSWTGDAKYYADALRWIMDQDRRLPRGQKIRVVSVSAAPSGTGSPFTMNGRDWDAAVKEATRAGILVLDCTITWGKIGPAYYDLADPEDVHKVTPGFPGLASQPDTTHLLAPASYRSVAETYQEGLDSWQYTGRGGLSWAIPWTAGVLAMGWQLYPALDANAIMKLLSDSAYVRPDGCRIIDPVSFIAAVMESKRHANVRTGR